MNPRSFSQNNHNSKKTKQEKSFWKIAIFAVIIGVCLFFGFGFLSRISSLQNTVGEFENIIVTDTKEMKIFAEQYLTQRYFFPRSNKIWFSRKNLEQALLQQFPRVGSLEIRVVSGQILSRGVERLGAYLWCGQNPIPISVDNKCYFADETGFVFDIAPFFSGGSYLRIFGGDTLADNIIGTQIISPDIIKLGKDFDNILKEYGFGIQAIHIVSLEQIEFILFSKNELPQSPRLRHYTGNDTSEVLHNLNLALKNEHTRIDIVGQYDILDYIDMRFANQMVYAFFDTTIQQPENNEDEIISEDIPENISDQENLQESSAQ